MLKSRQTSEDRGIAGTKRRQERLKPSFLRGGADCKEPAQRQRELKSRCEKICIPRRGDLIPGCCWNSCSDSGAREIVEILTIAFNPVAREDFILNSVSEKRVVWAAELAASISPIVKHLEHTTKASQELACKIGSHKKGDPQIGVRGNMLEWPERAQKTACEQD